MDNTARYMKMAEGVSSLSNCKRKKTGAVIIIDDCRFVIGHNNIPIGYDESVCERCPRENKIPGTWDKGEECPVTHAEVDAVLQAARVGLAIAGGTMYCTYKPCLPCARTVAEAGIKKVIYRDEYKGGQDVEDYLKRCGVELVRGRVGPVEGGWQKQ